MRELFDIYQRRALAGTIGWAALLIGLAMLSGCASASAGSTVAFVTELGTTNGLAAGSPVTYGGATIGSVSDLGWKLNGDTKVSFEVQYQYAQSVHQDSIMVLHTDAGPPALDLYNPSPNGAVALPGSKIDSASSQHELAALLTARGFTAVTSSMVGVAGALGSAAGASPPPAVTIDQLQRELAAVQAQAAANGSTNTAATAAQLHALNQQVQSLQQQMVTLGASPQAQQLRNEIDQLAHTLSTPPATPPSSSGTLVTPRVY